MFNSEKKVTVEWLEGIKDTETAKTSTCMSNPLTNHSNTDNLSIMVKKVLEEEIPHLKNNSLLYDLVLYSLVEKMNTVQNVGNVLSYMKENNAKTVHDVSIKSGEIRIKCSV